MLSQNSYYSEVDYPTQEKKYSPKLIRHKGTCRPKVADCVLWAVSLKYSPLLVILAGRSTSCP